MTEFPPARGYPSPQWVWISSQRNGVCECCRWEDVFYRTGGKLYFPMRNCLLRDIDRRHVDETSQQFYRPHPFTGENERQTALQKCAQATRNKKSPVSSRGCVGLQGKSIAVAHSTVVVFNAEFVVDKAAFTQVLF